MSDAYDDECDCPDCTWQQDHPNEDRYSQDLPDNDWEEYDYQDEYDDDDPDWCYEDDGYYGRFND